MITRRTFLQLAAAAPIAALAAWRPPAALAAERRSVDWDLAHGRDWTKLVLMVAFGEHGTTIVDTLPFSLPPRLRYTRLDFRGRSSRLRDWRYEVPRIVVQAGEERSGLWVDVVAMCPPCWSLHQVRLDELHPIAWTRELHVRWSV